MKSSTKWIIGITAALAVVALGAAAALATFLPVERSTDSTPPGDPTPVVDALADGTWFGYVRVNGDGGTILLMVDPAEMLTGPAAHDAAVDAGIISEEEDLPNDFFISNPDHRVFTNAVATDVVIRLISANDTSRELAVTPEELAALYNGSYSGEPVYGIVPDEPVVMNLTVTDGVVTEAQAVYLP